MLKKEELLKIQGGGIKEVMSFVGLAVGAAVTFFIGFLDGYINPTKCNSSK